MVDSKAAPAVCLWDIFFLASVPEHDPALVAALRRLAAEGTGVLLALESWQWQDGKPREVTGILSELPRAWFAPATVAPGLSNLVVDLARQGVDAAAARLGAPAAAAIGYRFPNQDIVGRINDDRESLDLYARSPDPALPEGPPVGSLHAQSVEKQLEGEPLEPEFGAGSLGAIGAAACVAPAASSAVIVDAKDYLSWTDIKRAEFTRGRLVMIVDARPAAAGGDSEFSIGGETVSGWRIISAAIDQLLRPGIGNTAARRAALAREPARNLIIAIAVLAGIAAAAWARREPRGAWPELRRIDRLALPKRTVIALLIGIVALIAGCAALYPVFSVIAVPAVPAVAMVASCLAWIVLRMTWKGALP
jgi:hypothetical protein